jgi:hypothetical protein
MGKIKQKLYELAQYVFEYKCSYGSDEGLEEYMLQKCDQFFDFYLVNKEIIFEMVDDMLNYKVY